MVEHFRLQCPYRYVTSYYVTRLFLINNKRPTLECIMMFFTEVSEHQIHHFRVDNSVAVGPFTMLYSHPDYLIPNLLHHPTIKLFPRKQLFSPDSYPQFLATADLLCLYRFVYSGCFM